MEFDGLLSMVVPQPAVTLTFDLNFTTFTRRTDSRTHAFSHRWTDPNKVCPGTIFQR